MVMMTMMQERFNDDNNRSLNYTKIDRCQDNICIDNDEFYKQIIHTNEHRNSHPDITIIFTYRCRLILFLLLILTSQSTALPIYQTQGKFFPHEIQLMILIGLCFSSELQSIISCCYGAIN